MGKFKTWAPECTLVVGKIYRQCLAQKRIFHSLVHPSTYEEAWHKNNKGIPFCPDLDQSCMFIGRKFNETKSTRLYDRFDYFFLCGEDLFSFSLWDDNIKRFEKIWKEVS